MKGRLLLRGIIALFVMIATAATAEVVAEGEYVLQYKVYSTATLSDEKASEFSTIKDRHSGLLYVRVLRRADKTMVPAQVQVIAKKHHGALVSLQLREVRRPGKIFYVGEFPVGTRDDFRFTLQARPQGSKEILTAKVQQEFFVD